MPPKLKRHVGLALRKSVATRLLDACSVPTKLLFKTCAKPRRLPNLLTCAPQLPRRPRRVHVAMKSRRVLALATRKGKSDPRTSDTSGSAWFGLPAGYPKQSPFAVCGCPRRAPASCHWQRKAPASPESRDCSAVKVMKPHKPQN